MSFLPSPLSGPKKGIYFFNPKSEILTFIPSNFSLYTFRLHSHLLEMDFPPNFIR